MLERVSLGVRGNERFAARRRVRRRRILIASVVLLAIAIGGIVYELRQSAVRIAHVEIFGADQSFSTFAFAAMEGSYFGIIPRNSTFFFSASHIRANIIAMHPDVAAVSIFRNGLTGLSIKIIERIPVARWCGLTPTPGVDEYCYVFDASGFVFAPAASSTQTLNSFSLYARLVGDTEEPLRATVSQADRLPTTFDFARQLNTFGPRVTHIVLRDDEVDDYLSSGTRITYVLGNEQNAFTALTSARENLNLSDGSIDYVDLRFDGKVYLKKRPK